MSQIKKDGTTRNIFKKDETPILDNTLTDGKVVLARTNISYNYNSNKNKESEYEKDIAAAIIEKSLNEENCIELLKSMQITTKKSINSKQGKVENIRVFIRIRPFNKIEKDKNSKEITSVNTAENIITLNHPKLQDQKTFTFDYIFTQDSAQIDLYKHVAATLVQQIFKGYNATIFAYGQTGSGKTYTMTGKQTDDHLKGIIPNTFSDIFDQISKATCDKSFVVTATYLEIYNEDVCDLLSKTPNQKLPVREQSLVGVYVDGLTGFTVESVESLDKLMKIGDTNRKTRSTAMNDVSTRSHVIFTIMLEAKDKTNKTITIAKLNLVDLAGSERLHRSHVTGDGLRETANINQSLFVLSNVISALVEGKHTHIPYRNSKLTRLLQDSLGGNSKTAMIATISPSEFDHDETLCTLRYASRVKLIKNHVKLNLQPSNSLLEHLESQIDELKKQLVVLSLHEQHVLEEKKKRQEKCNRIIKRKARLAKLDTDLLDIYKVKAELQAEYDEKSAKVKKGQKRQTQQEETAVEECEDESSFQVIEEMPKKLTHKEEPLQLTLQDKNKLLDEEIEKVENLIKEVQIQHDMEQERYREDYNLLLGGSCSATRELDQILAIATAYIPKHEWKKINSNVEWNEEITDFRINGVAYLGNNRNNKLKYIPKTETSGMLLPQRKNKMPKKVITKTTRSIYRSYPQTKTDKNDIIYE